MVPGPLFLWYSAVVAVTSAGLALSATLEEPRAWAMLGLTLVAVAAGTHYLSLAHEGYRFYPQRPATFAYWPPPVALALGGTLFTRAFLGGGLLLVGLVGTAVALAVLLYSQHLLARPGGFVPAFARLATNLGIYLATFLLFVSLENSDLPPAARLVALGLSSGLLSLSLFRDRAGSPGREALYAGLVSLLVMQLGWALQLLPLGKVITGLLLLVAFYVTSGLVHSHLLNRLSRGVVLEFGAVTAVALFVLFGFQVATA